MASAAAFVAFVASVACVASAVSAASVASPPAAAAVAAGAAAVHVHALATVDKCQLTENVQRHAHELDAARSMTFAVGHMRGGESILRQRLSTP